MLDGWFEVTPSLLDDHRGVLTPTDLKLFFDGVEPRWRHALAPADQIPRRPLTVDGLAKLRQPNPETQALVLLVGAGGQGKSTALLQMAADLVAEGRRVLVRSPGARLDPQSVMELATGTTWVLVSDDADEIAHDVEKAVQLLFGAGRRDIHWLLSARDIEWKYQFLSNSRTIEPPWHNFADLWPALGNRVIGLAVTEAEAATVLATWTGAGALGAFATLAAHDRAEAIEDRATKKHGLSDATLLGASLDLRHGAAGVATLVSDAVAGLDGDPAADAFLFAAGAQVAGVDGVDLFVLADLVGVPRRDRRLLLVRLADAGLASGSAGALRVRHPALAQAAVRLIDSGRIGAGVEDLFRRLVRGTATTGNDVKSLAAGGAIMSCGPLLAEKLEQLGLSSDLANHVACVVADEAEAALGDYLLFTVARARTYREASRPGDSRAILRDRLTDATTKHDWDMAGRAFLHELSVPEAEIGQLVEAVTLAGLALADGDGLGQVTMADAKLALLSLGESCRRLGTADGDDGALFRRQLRSCHHLGEKVTPKWDQKARFQFHTMQVAADEYGIPKTTAAEALIWLAETVKSADKMVVDADLAELAHRLAPVPGDLGFSHLEKTIGLGRLPWAKE